MDAEVTVYRGRQGLSELGELWSSLVDRMEHRSFIHAYEWHRSFLETQEPHPEASLFVVVSADGLPRAILPLRPIRRLPILGRRGLEVPFNPHVPFTDIVADDPARLRPLMPIVLSKIAPESGESWDYLAVRRTPDDSCAARCLTNIPGFPGGLSASRNYQVSSLGPFDELWNSLSGNARSSLRRALKRAEAMGDITYHTARSRSECDALFPDFLEVEASGWKGRSGTRTAIAIDSGLRRFYTALMHSFADRGRCRIDVARLDGRPIAAAFHLVMDQTVYELKIGFDESHAEIAPGNLLHWYILRSACEDPQIETFNWTSDAPWHSRWRPDTGHLVDVVVAKPGVAGRIASIEERVSEQVRSWRRLVAGRWIVNERGRRRLVWPPRPRA